MPPHKSRHDLYERALQVEIAKVKAMSLPANLDQLACRLPGCRQEKNADGCTVLDVGSGDGILAHVS